MTKVTADRLSTRNPASVDAALASRDQLDHRDQRATPELTVRTALLELLANQATTAELIQHLARSQSHALSVLLVHPALAE